MAPQIDETLIEALYGTAVQDGNWRPALDRFCHLLNSCDAAITIAEVGPRLLAAESAGRVLSPENRRRYAERFIRLDPKMKILARSIPGYLFNDARHFDEQFVARDVFYQEYSRSVGTRHTLDLLAERRDNRDVFLAVMRERRAGPYDQRAENLFCQIGRHFVRALALKEKMDCLHRAQDTLDGLDFGVLVVDSFRHVILLNRSGEAQLNEAAGLRLSRGLLAARSPSADRKLQSLIDFTLAGNREGGVMRLTNGDGTSVVLRVAPLPENRRIHAQVSRAVLVLLCAGGKCRLEAADLAMLYGLTPTESRVALALAEGARLSAIAALHGVKYSTVRTQLLSLMQKMGVHRQADVARLLVSTTSRTA